MLLAIDVGNTQTVFGLYADVDAPELLDHWRVATAAERTSDEHALFLQAFLAYHGVRASRDIDGVAISSGVPRVTAALREMTSRYFGFPALVLGPGVRTGMPILYDNPRDVGADRIADAVAAYDLYGGPVIVVDFGTATSLEAVSAAGEYLGGAIIPGIEISLDALYARASALRRVELGEPRSPIGRTTIESIQSGVLYGTVAMVDGMVARFEDELGPSTVVATGGLGGLIAPLSSAVQHHQPWLTLHGLRLIYRMNASVGGPGPQ